MGAPVPRNKLGDAETMDGVGTGAASRGSEMLRTEAGPGISIPVFGSGLPLPLPMLWKSGESAVLKDEGREDLYGVSLWSF